MMGMNLRWPCRGLAVLSLVCLAVPARAQEPVYRDVIGKIEEEGFQRSQVMDLVGYMTDVLGHRVTSSHGMRRAQLWAKAKMDSLGLMNTVIESFGEHGVGWDNEYTSLHMLEPDYQPLIRRAFSTTRPCATRRCLGRSIPRARPVLA